MFAVFKRNFLAYFLNPTGYVFICVFVLLSSAAAFLPDDFVNSNLANLSQLNVWFPLVALIFVPAISMNVWADERRFGTDELLTTQPVATFSIVLGKYLAAALVYTVSLLFSAVSNYAILKFLGSPDAGLFLTTYCGYWLIGVAATAIASIASYLTSQLTVAYILGVLFNVPFVALQWADALPIPARAADILKSFGISAFFEPFGRGMFSVSSVVYFLAIPAVSVYICFILLDHKTWREKSSKRIWARCVYRVLASTVLAISVVGFLRDHDLRFDCTEEKLSALSPETIKLLNEIDAPYPIVIEARLSAQVPREYVQTKLNIISNLNEFKNRSKSPIFLDIRDVAPNTREAYRLERQYDARPRKVVFSSRGQLREESIFMTIIFRCGSRSVVIPFLNKGLSVEYELISSIRNVSAATKKRIGILKTDAGVTGRVDDFGREIQKPWPIVEELSKQYIVETVDPSLRLEPGKYDAILAFQPSSLGTIEELNFINAVRQGQPTAIFEDPLPIFLDFLPGTIEKRRPTPMNPLPPLKGEINMLWAALGIKFCGADVLWKNYNPYPKLAGLSEEYLFVDKRPIRYSLDGDADASNSSQEERSFAAFNPNEPVVASLEHILFPFVGYIEKADNSETNFIPLISTEAGGYSAVEDVAQMGIRTQSRNRLKRDAAYALAARITGSVPKAFRVPQSTLEASKSSRAPEYNVIVVADVDMATPGFFTLREMGTDVRSGVSFDFDNIAFVLNAIDELTGEESLVSIRSRRPRHRTLARIEEATRKIRDRAAVAQIAYAKEFEEERRKEEANLQKTIQELSERDQSSKELSREESVELQSSIVAAQQRLAAVLDEKKRKYDGRVEEEQREVNEYVRQTQGRYKTYAAILPPLPPLLIGLAVYYRRKKRQGSVYGL